MAVNSSSSSNDSLLHPNLSPWMDCFFTKPNTLIFTIFSITNILLFLPLYVLILYLGFQRCRQQRSTSSAAVMSHTDIFTYNLTSIELIGVLGCTISCCAIYGNQVSVFIFGTILRSFTWYGQMSFHILTCVERYLAVVHPVTYLSLRGERGIRIRNISIGCVWLLCFGESTLETLEGLSVFFNLCFLIFSLVVISFCSVSVLFILIRPGPGEQGGERERVDQSKRRAFYTIMAILGVLLLRCAIGLVWVIFYVLRPGEECVFIPVSDWFNVPSSLVLPLLFLIRAGTLACCKNNNE